MKRTTNYLKYTGLSFYCFLCCTCTLQDLPPEKNLSGGFILTDSKVLSNPRTLAVTNKGEIVTNDDNIIKVWNLQTNTLVKSIKLPSGIPNAIALTPDEKYLFVTNGININQYDFGTGGLVKQIDGHTSDIYDLAISGDGKTLVSSSYDKTVKTWDVPTSSLLKSMTVGSSVGVGYVYKLAINYNGSKIVGAFFKNIGASDIYEIITLNATTGTEISRFSQSYYIFDVAIDKAGKFVFVNIYNIQIGSITIKVINTETKQTIKDISASYTLAISPDDKYVATGEQLFNTLNYTQSWYKFRHVNYFANQVAFSNNGNYIGSVSSDEGTMALATLDGAETKQNRLKHEGFITNATLSKDGNNAVIFDASGKAIYWDLATKSEKYTINIQGSPFPYITLMTDNSIAAGYNDSFKVWNKSNGAIKYSIPLNTFRIANSPDNKFYVISLINGENRILEAETGKVLFNLSGSNSYPILTGVSPDNKKVISLAIDKKIRIWDAANGAIIKTLDISSLVNNSNNLYSPTLSPDGNNLAIGYYDNSYKMLNYSIALENKISQFNISDYPQSLDFSKDGQNIVVGNGGNKTVQVYNVQTGTLQKERSFDNYIVNVAFNPSGTQIYVTTNKDFQIISAK